MKFWRIDFILILVSFAYFLLRALTQSQGIAGLQRFGIEFVVFSILCSALYYLLKPCMNGAIRVGMKHRLLAVAMALVFLRLLWEPLTAGIIWPNASGSGYIETRGFGERAQIPLPKKVSVARQGYDDIRNFIAIKYFAEAKCNPFTLNEIYEKAPPAEKDLLTWHFSHHPPGLPFFYVLLAPNYILCRILAFGVFLSCGIALGTAIALALKDRVTGIGMGILFIALPAFLVIHGIILSIDILAALPLFLSFAIFLWGISNSQKFRMCSWLAGIAMGLACLVKYSTAYWCGVQWVWLFLFYRRQALLHLPVAVFCVGISLFFGFIYSYIAWGNNDFTLLNVIFDNPSTVPIAEKVRPGLPGYARIFKIFMFGFYHIGPPILFFTAVSIFRGLRNRLKIVQSSIILTLCILPLVLVFASGYRHAYPAIILILLALNVPHYFQTLAPNQKILIGSTLLAFSLTKFISKFWIIGIA